MTKCLNPRLCGGTFFTLVLEALRPRLKAREYYKGESDGLNDPDVLVGLLKVINPEYEKPHASLNSITNSYKSCKISKSRYFPFDDVTVMDVFDRRVREKYQEAMAPMTDFVKSFLEIGTENKKDVGLVKALLDLIEQDSTIPDDEEFFVDERGKAIKKAAFGGIGAVCLPAFLLGVWHYATINRKNNRVGRDTYDEWCPPNGGAIRKYRGKMGKTLSQDIIVFMPSGFQNKAETSEEETADAQPFDGPNAQAESPQMTQIINNPFVIQQNGDNNTVISNSGTITIIKR